MYRIRRWFAPALVAMCALLALDAQAQQYADPPERVARLAYVEGSVSFTPAGERDWLRAMLNRPHVRGDRLWSDRRSRTELQLGAAALRLAPRTSIEILELSDRLVQVELTQGSVSLHVRRMRSGESYEISTPTLALVIEEPGDYRVDVDARGEFTEVIVIRGAATAYGDRANFELLAGDDVRFYDSTLQDYEFIDDRAFDEFDRFVDLRNQRFDRSPSLRYVPDDLIGYSDLDDYGSWSQSRDYGAVWYPTRVDAGWAPYRYGQWIWQDPWGWTWVDDAPWGFASSHYGRWAFVDRRWGWIPSPRRSRPVYAPALVAFVGGNNWSVSISGGRTQPIGWFPLGPREVYVPSYRASRDYFNRVNRSNTLVDDAYLGTSYNNWNSGRGLGRFDYMHRRRPESITAVPRDVFVNARPVRGSSIRLDQANSASAELSNIAAMAPVARSYSGGSAASAVAVPREVYDRRVISRNRTGPAPMPFERRRQMLQGTPGVPLATDAEAMRPRGRDDATVRVVGETGTEVVRDENRQRGQGRGRGRGRGPETGTAPAAAPGTTAEQEREAIQAQREAARDQQRRTDGPSNQAAAQRETIQRQAEQQQREREAAEAQRQQQEQAREGERAQREAERAAREAQQQQDGQRQQQEQMQQQREAERAQREAEREAQRAQQDQQRDAQRQQQEQARGQREAEQAQREAERQQQEAQRAQQEQQQQQQEAQRAQQEQQKQQQEAERAQREAEQAAQQQQAQQQREAEQAQREAQRAEQEAQQQQQEAQRAAQQAEREQREAERAQREAEKEQEEQQAEEGEGDEGRGRGRGRKKD